MAENKSTIDEQNKQTNHGANDARLKPMNEEQRDIATKGGKATPKPIQHAPSATTQDEDGGESSEDNRTNGDQRGKNSDDEINARGGLMGGATKPGAEELKR
jgi:hypothetical protein